MTITPFAFVPPNGIRDASYAPTDPPNEAALRQAIQGIPDQLKDYINDTLLPTLASTTASSSGAREIGSETLPGIVGNTVYAQLLALLNYINSISIGNVPINSITNDKLATDVKVGSLAALNTADKTSVVNAINETNTASNMLDKIKTVDGSGSGLDADLWRGWKIYGSFAELGLGTTPTITQIATAMADKSKLEIDLYNATYISAPYEYTHLTLIRHTRNFIEAIAVDNNFYAPLGMSKGKLNLDAAGNQFNGWKPLAFNDPTVTTITTGFASGWSGVVDLRKNLNGFVEVSINLVSSVDITQNLNLILCTLPIGFRPFIIKNQNIEVITAAGFPTTPIISSLLINTSGQLILSTPTLATGSRYIYNHTFTYYAA